MRPPIVAVCILLGIATEITAAALGWWLYDPAWLRVVNVVVVFGGVFGWIASTFAARPVWQRFAAGAAFGIAYEAMNLAALGWWTFPGNRLLMLDGPLALVIGVGLSWGAIPVVAPLVADATATSSS